MTCFSTSSFVHRATHSRVPTKVTKSHLFSAPSDVETGSSFTSLFNFSKVEEDAVSNFDRIDDAIMGGISLSAIRQMPGEDFARWSGICRTDGGGFCGTRTLPFKTPLQVGNAEGIYILCRLTSDDEPERRVWKVTTRSEQSRSEQLYQSMFELPKPTNNDWSLVKINFKDFVQVRGPRVVENGPPLDTKNGIFQIGLVLSKFMISNDGTTVDNFRDGYFELQVQEIGVFKNGDAVSPIEFSGTLEKKEADKKKPVMLKILTPVAKLLFSEKRRRRASAVRILKKRGFTRLQRIKYSLDLRVRRNGWPLAIAQAIGNVVQDTIRLALFWSLRLTLVYPISLIRKSIRLLTKAPKAKTETE